MQLHPIRKDNFHGEKYSMGDKSHAGLEIREHRSISKS